MRCQASNHLMAVKTTEAPLALARADQVENTGTLLTLICNQESCAHSEKIEIGATVEVSKLTDDNRTLARLVSIHSVTGGTIQYEQGKSVDLSPYLKDIINSVAGDFDFLVYTH